MTEYWLNLEGCNRIVRDLTTLVENVGDTEFQWVDDDLSNVDRYSYAAEESAVNAKPSAEDLDKQYREFLEDKLQPTFDAMWSELNANIRSLAEVVHYYATGDAAMAYDATAHAETEFPEFLDDNGDPVTGHDRPQTEGKPGVPNGFENLQNAGEPLSEDHYSTRPFAAARAADGNGG